MKAAFSKRAVLAILGGLLASCSTTSKRVQFSPDEIVADLATRIPEDVAQKVVVPYDINDEIRELARKSVDTLRTDSERTRANVNVTTIERISKEAEVIVNNGHITAGIRQGPELVMIDFTRTPEREYMGAKVIDDFEAIANYYNNQGFLYGYYSETAGDMGDEFDPAAAELEMYQMALDVRPNFGRARNNLGVALRRRGRVEEAIAQYKLALEEDPKFAEARSNLGAAYYSQLPA